MSASALNSEFLEGYEKVRTVGKGAFGTASLYKRKADDMHVVMKEVFMADMTKEERKMALNEVDILSRLKHSNIIRYMGSFERDGTLTIIMEYANGGNLAQLISYKKSQKAIFSEKAVLQIAYQISGALAYMHKNKILHRDLKAANIFLNRNGAIKVGDFGISKILNTKNQAETIIGTPYYLSPEMCEGKDYNEKSDIWAFGCILYELLSLKRPFEASSLPILVQKITMCQFEDIPPLYSEGLHHLVYLILQRNYSSRPTAQDIHEIIIPGISRNSEILNDINILLANSSIDKYGLERSLLYRISLTNGISSPVPYELPNKKFISAACSKNHYIAVAEDHSVYTWGEDNMGQLAQGQQAVYRKHPICVDFLQGKNIEKCAAGNKFSIFLAKSGLLLSCGEGKNGCLGHGDWNAVLRPKLIDSLITSVIIDVACGSDHVLALTVDRRVFAWGLSEHGQLGLGEKKFCCAPAAIKLENSFAASGIFAGDNASAVLSADGQLLLAGSNKYNKLGLGGAERISAFTQLKAIGGKIVVVALGASHTLLLTAEGNLYAMGRNAEGQLGAGNCKTYATYQRINFFNREIKMVCCGPTYTIAATKRNVLYFWGTHYKNSSESRSAVSSNELIMERLSSSLEQTNHEKEEVLKPKSVLALYSSINNEKNNNYLKIGDILTQDYGILLLVHTTTHLPKSKNNENDNKYLKDSVKHF